MNPPEKQTKALLGVFLLALAAGTSVYAQPAAAPAAGEAKASNEEALVLSPFQVKADSNVGYGATHTSSAARVVQVYIEVPQTVNVVTSEFIDDFNLKDQHRLLQYVPNVAISQGNGLFIRGAPTGQVYVDGIVSGNGALRGIPAQFYDRIEVVKGPSSAAFGLGEPAGVVNYLSKTANGSEQQRYEVGIGEYSSYQAEFDFQGRHRTNDKLAYRLVGYWADGTGPIANTQKYGGAGAQLSLRYDQDPTLSFQAIVNYARDNTPYQSDQAWWFSNKPGAEFLHRLGLPMIDPILSKDVNLTPDFWGNQITYDKFKMTLIADKAFLNDKVNFRNTLRIENAVGKGKYTTASNVYEPSPGLFQTGVDLRDTSNKQNAFTENIDLSAKFVAGGIKFLTIGGFNYRFSNSSNYSKIFTGLFPNGTPYRINMHDPDISIPFAPLNSPGMVGNVVTDNRPSNEAYGFYLQEDISFLKNDMITVSVGARNDHSRSVTKNQLTNTSVDTGWVSPDIAPRYALSFKPVSWLNAYVLYAKHLDPSSIIPKYSRSIIGGPISDADLARFENFEPQLVVLPSGIMKEAGIKANLFGDKLTVTAAVFRETIGGATTNNTIIFTNPDGSSSQVVVNYLVEKEIEGYEVEIFGQPTKRLTITAALGVAKGTATAPNFNRDATPPSTASFHLRYDFGDLKGNGLYVLAGGIHYGAFWIYQDRINPALNTYYPDDQNSFDAGVGYRWKTGQYQHKVALTANNVTDEAISVGFDGNNYVTQPRRQVMLTYGLSF